MAKCIYSGRSKPCDKVGAYCLTWQKQCTVEPRLMATSLLRPLFWLPGKNDHTFSCKETLVNTVTSLLQPNFFGPLVTILMGFHCMLEFNGPARAHFLTSVVNPYNHCRDSKDGCCTKLVIAQRLKEERMYLPGPNKVGILGCGGRG